MDILSPIAALLLLCNQNPSMCLVLENENSSSLFIGACLDPNKEYTLEMPTSLEINEGKTKIEIIIDTKCTNV